VIEIRDGFYILPKNKPTVFEFDDIDVYDVPITDPITRKQKLVQRFQLHVTSIDGIKSDTSLSIVSKKAKEHLNAFQARGVLLTRPIRITKSGVGFFTEYSFEIL